MPTNRSWVLAEAAFYLRAQGRFAEALPAYRAGLRMHEDAKEWHNAAIGASNLSQTELLVGELAAAVATAERCVAHADRSADGIQMMVNRTTHADALHAAGQHGHAALTFADAERRQKVRQPEYPLLYSVWGYRYCDLLLAKGDHTAARDRASATLVWIKPEGDRLSIALDTLALGRAHLGLALAIVGAQRPAAAARDDARTARARLDETVDGLRAAGTLDDVPRGLLARAAFRCSVGDWEGAARDLDEVEEIAEPGPMRLFLCDMALERARLAFARGEAFAPLNGLIDDSPPKSQPPGDTDSG
jgi:tetratricopeptide (TPR) repeat protein